MNTIHVVVNGQTYEISNARVGELLSILERWKAVDLTEVIRQKTASQNGGMLLNG